MELALNFRGDLQQLSPKLVDELDQLTTSLSASLDEILDDDDTLKDGVVSPRHISGGWSGTVAVGGQTLTFENGILTGVS